MIRATWKNRIKSRTVPLTHISAIIVERSFLVQIRVARGKTFRCVYNTIDTGDGMPLLPFSMRGSKGYVDIST